MEIRTELSVLRSIYILDRLSICILYCIAPAREMAWEFAANILPRINAGAIYMHRRHPARHQYPGETLVSCRSSWRTAWRWRVVPTGPHSPDDRLSRRPSRGDVATDDAEGAHYAAAATALARSHDARAGGQAAGAVGASAAVGAAVGRTAGRVAPIDTELRTLGIDSPI